MKKQFLNTIKVISEVLNTAGAIQEYEEFTRDEQEFHEILNLCYELLARTAIAREQLVKQPEEEPHEYLLRYGMSSDELADFTFAFVTLSGKISLVSLFNQILERVRLSPKKITAAEISEKTGISTNTISTFRNGKGNMTCRNFETIINYILQK